MVLSDGVIQPEHLPPAVQRMTRGARPPRRRAAGGAAGHGGSLDEALEDWERRT